MNARTATDSRWRGTDGRLRAWLRIVIVIATMLVATALIQMTPLWLELDRTPALALQAVLVALVSVALFNWLTSRLDRRSIRSYGIALDSRWWADLGAGAVIGLLVGMIAMVVLVGGGWASVSEVWSPGDDEPAVGIALAVVIAAQAAVALWEELVFRGHLMSNAAEALARNRPLPRAVVGAWLISTVVFAAVHLNQLLDPRALPTFALLWLAMGALFGLAYAYTGQLGLPIGIHLGGNLSLGPLFGLPGELGDEMAMLVRLDIDGPTWLVAGGGVAQFLGVAAAFAALWLWLRWRRAPSALDESIAQPHARKDHEYAQ